MNIYDIVPARDLEDGDQFLFDGIEPVEIHYLLDSLNPEEVIVSGYSHDSGDTETYVLGADDMVSLWSV